MDLGRRLLSEGLGTFFMVFAGCGAVMVNEVSGGALGHFGVSAVWGLIVAVVIYSIGEISGAHLNPAVTLGFYIRKEFPLKLVGPYIGVQIAGATLASLLLVFILPEATTTGATLPVGSLQQSFLMEVVISFLLMFVILQVATGSKEQGLMAGIAIGATVGLCATLAGPISGASMNPARSIGPAIAAGNFDYLWAYIAAPITGAAMAALLSFKLKYKPKAA